MRLEQFVNSPDRRLGLAGVVLCVLCAGYFYLIDFAIFSAAGFTHIFWLLLAYYDVYAAWVGVLVCALAALWTKPAPVQHLVDFLGKRPLMIAITCVALFAMGTLVVYHNYPLCMDEYAAVFQSKIFASGRVTAFLPPSVVDWLVLPGFNGYFLIASSLTGQAIEAYWPGFALLLAPFQFIGAPWLCNAALSGLALFLAHRTTLDVTGDRRAAGWAILFTLGSGVFWANGISYYSMQAHLTANMLFAWLLLNPTMRRSFAAGLVGGLALSLHNPLPHVLFATPWLIALALDKRTLRRVPAVVLGYVPALIVLVGWAWLRRDIAPASWDSHAIGNIMKGVFMWPDEKILNMRVAAAVKMWVWAVPCLFCIAVLGFLRNRSNASVRLLALTASLTFVGYLFVDLDQGHGWGYRYFHSAWGVVPVLAACALSGRQADGGRLVPFAGAASVLSFLILVPFQLTQIEGFVREHLAMIPAPRRPGSNVYFIDPRGGPYLGDTIQMDPLLRSPDLLLASRGREMDEQLVRQNWPGAIRGSRTDGVQQWYLGPSDPRVSTHDGNGAPHFILIYRSDARSEKGDGSHLLVSK